MRNSGFIGLVVVVLLLAGCGGGSGGGDDDSGSSNGGNGGGSTNSGSNNGGNGGGSTNGSGVGNSAPVADAGDRQSVTTGSAVRLNGSDSSDPDGDTLSYNWSFDTRPAGSQATLQDADTPAPRFIADVAGRYVVDLVVNDGQVASQTASVTAIAADDDAPPMADAGRNQNVAVSDTVQLDGSASMDINGDDLTYRWQFRDRPSGSSAQLDNPNTASPSFTADVAGDYVVSLVVNDGNTDSAADRVTITAATGNVAPVADAGDDQRGPAGATVQLDGTGSSDADGDSLSYQWQFVSRPQGSSASLQDPDTATPSFAPDTTGNYVVRLTVTDDTGASDTNQVLIDSRPGLVLSLDLSTFPQIEGGGFLVVGLPYFQVAGPTITSDPGETGTIQLNGYKLRAIGQDFTVTNLTAMVLNDSPNTDIDLSFDGLNDGTTIPDGETRTFGVVTNLPDDGVYRIQYRFEVQGTNGVFQAQYENTYQTRSEDGG